jgi:hypothetical protein
MQLLVRLENVKAARPFVSARVSVNGTAAEWALEVGQEARFQVPDTEAHCVVHLEFFCSKPSGLVLPIGTTVVDLAGKDLSKPLMGGIWSWDGGADSKVCGNCCFRVTSQSVCSWTPVPDLEGLGFDKVLSGQLSSTWARFGGKFAPIKAGIGLDNIHSPYYQQRVNLHGHASALMPIRYWVESGTETIWTEASALGCLRYYCNALIVTLRRHSLLDGDAVMKIASDKRHENAYIDMLMFPCRFIRYRQDFSPIDGQLTDAYQDPYIPGHDAIADCEDFSKVIQLSYYNLLDAAAFVPDLVPALLRPALDWLRKYEVVILQGAANVPGESGLKNHVWAGLVGTKMLEYMISDVGTVPPKNPLPSLLLEGTCLSLGSSTDTWTPCKDVENFYAYTMAMHVAPKSPLGGDYELVCFGDRPVYAMPTALFFNSDWGNWRALKVNATTKGQDKAAEEWMRMVEIPRRVPHVGHVLQTGDVPMAKFAHPSRTRGIPIDKEWKLWFHV